RAVTFALPRRRGRGSWFQRAVPFAGIDVGWSHLDAVLARIAHQLRGGIEAHGLGIEQRRAKGLGEVPFHPRRDIDQDGEARGMALGEAVFAEALDLLEAALGEFALVVVADHAVDEIVLELVDGARAAEGRHGAPELVGL